MKADKYGTEKGKSLGSGGGWKNTADSYKKTREGYEDRKTGRGVQVN